MSDLICKECGKQCGTRAGLVSHRRAKHPQAQPTALQSVPELPDDDGPAEFEEFDGLTILADEETGQGGIPWTGWKGAQVVPTQPTVSSGGATATVTVLQPAPTVEILVEDRPSRRQMERVRLRVQNGWMDLPDTRWLLRAVELGDEMARVLATWDPSNPILARWEEMLS